MTTTTPREFTNPLLVPIHERMTLPWLLEERVRRYPNHTLVERKVALGSAWQKVTSKAFANDVHQVAKGIIGLGLQPGDKFGIMAHTSYDWMLLDFAIAHAGLVSVPIYETSSAEQIEWIVTDSETSAVVTETHAMADLVRSAAPKLANVFSLDRNGIAQLIAAGKDVPDSAVDERSRAVGSDDLMTIIYTSGTTGRPKGVELTHVNFVGLACNGRDWMPELLHGKNSRVLLFLPLAHVFARFIQLLPISAEGVVGHCPDTKNLLEDIASFKPWYVLAVPRVFEKIYNAADAKAGSGAKLKMFRWAAKVAIEYSRALETEAGPSKALTAQHKLAGKLVHHKIMDLFGGAKFAVSGGGPLGDRLGHFFRGIGLQILEGYGLTETSAPLSVNTPAVNKIGTVGPPISGVAVRVDEEGEIQVKGPWVFKRYHNNPEATEEAFVDGWFHTGDVGSIDEDGYVKITGRRKELIVTAGGKNVAPTLLEDRLRGHPLVSQVVVVGEGKPFIGALVTLDAEMLPGWLKNHGMPTMSVEQAARDPQVIAAIDRAVERANKAVSRAESIRKFKVLDTDFTEANGMLTPSLKIKRGPIAEEFASEIEALYS
ncbi:long-chain fatty acid--CoA ligase [Bowdeniella nasicola]|uniref:Acyl-CoA synthetase n=1 Tax=Bowdeniella nasicola TaxID=208480 RepID=A0A1Q5Q077_9ACTO|nr:AMP-dependent synthetase/ligase [Bowdeniella nasicola]OKL53115.1 long-chain fatty acid--CoA ligase [Bowdeniella nasicola]